MEERIFKALSNFCDRTLARSDSPTKRPFAVKDDNGGMWTMFTDGHALVAVRGAYEGVEPYEGRYKLREHLYPYLTTTYGEGEEHVVDFKELADWLGVPSVDKCPVCCQSGHTEADPDRFLDIRHPKRGLLYDMPINRNLLAYPLAYLRAEAVQVIVRPRPNMTLLATPTWRVLLIGLDTREGCDDAFPAQSTEEIQAA